MEDGRPRDASQACTERSSRSRFRVAPILGAHQVFSSVSASLKPAQFPDVLRCRRRANGPYSTAHSDCRLRRTRGIRGQLWVEGAVLFRAHGMATKEEPLHGHSSVRMASPVPLHTGRCHSCRPASGRRGWKLAVRAVEFVRRAGNDSLTWSDLLAAYRSNGRVRRSGRPAPFIAKQLNCSLELFAACRCGACAIAAPERRKNALMLRQ